MTIENKIKTQPQSQATVLQIKTKTSAPTSAPTSSQTTPLFPLAILILTLTARSTGLQQGTTHTLYKILNSILLQLNFFGKLIVLLSEHPHLAGTERKNNQPLITIIILQFCLFAETRCNFKTFFTHVWLNVEHLKKKLFVVLCYCATVGVFSAFHTEGLLKNVYTEYSLHLTVKNTNML